MGKSKKPICAGALFILLLLTALPAMATTWQQTGGPEGGQIQVLAIDPNHSQTIFAGTVGFGVFKSTNGGATWSPMNGWLNNPTSVSALAIDPANSQTIYGATLGGGVIKSTDGSLSWRAVNSGLTTTTVSSLAIDPKSSHTVYAGTFDSGVFKSTNGGGTWSAMNSGLANASVQTLAVDPTDGQTIFAGTAGGVFKSTNAGVSWSAQNGGLTGTSVRSIAIDPSSGQIIYVGTTNGGVFRSGNGGGSWSAMNAGLPGTMAQFVTLDPTNNQTLYAGIWGGGVFKSTNGGSWSPIDTALAGTYVQTLVIDPNSSQTIYVATSGVGKAVFKSSDGGVTWSARNAGLTATYILSCAVDRAGQTLYAGTNGDGLFSSGNGGGSWSALNNGLANTNVTSLAVDPDSSGTVYAGTAGGVFRSSNGGGSWNQAFFGAAVYALAIDPASSQTVYAGTWDSGVLKSSNGGLTWNAVNGGLTSLNVPSLAIDPASSQTIYAGTNGGGVFKSTNGGGTWSAVNNGLPGSVYIPSLAVDPAQSQTIYAGTFGSGVFKSTDGGNSWIAINSGFPVKSFVGVTALAINPANSQVIYAGVSAWGGVYKSSDGGGTWDSVNSGLTLMSVLCLAIDPGNSQAIYIGTNGGGVFVLPMPTISGTPAAGVTAGNPYRFTPTATNAAGFSISNKPAWTGFDTATGALTGTPAAADAGSYANIVISASNSTGTVSLPVFSITVAPLLPTISGTPTASVTAGNIYSFIPTASNATSFSMTGNLPPGLSFNTTNGALSGIPTRAGNFSDLVISANNANGSAATPSFSIMVTPGGDGSNPISATLLGISYNSSTAQNELRKIDPGTGVGTLVSSFTFDSGYWSRTSFCLDSETGSAYAQSSAGTLYKINFITGAVATSSLDRTFQTIKTGRNGSLVGIFYNDSTSQYELRQINPNTGASTLIASLAFDTQDWSQSSFCADRESGSVYAESTAGTLYTINFTTGAMAKTSLDRTFQALRTGTGGSLAGIFHNTSTARNELRQIDPTTGASTLVASFSFDSAFWPTDTFGLDSAGNSAYAVSSNGTLYSLDLTTGACSTSPTGLALQVLDNFPPSPTIGGTPATGATTGTVYRFTPTAKYATSFNITGDIPPGLDFSTTTGTLSGTPTTVGTYDNIVISASNGVGIAFLPAFSIAAAPPMPAISGLPSAAVTTGNAYSFVPSATNAAGFGISSKPPWADFDARTGALTGAPTNADAGAYDDIVISATNSAGTVSLPAFTIVVIAVYPSGNATDGVSAPTVADALIALKAAVGIITLSKGEETFLDVAPLVSGKPAPDGVVDVKDALLILRKTVGLVTW